MEEQKPDLEVVHKQPTYHKFEDAYGRLRKSEQDLMEKTHIIKPKYIAEKCDQFGCVPPEQKQTKYDNQAFNEIQANTKKPYPFDKKEGDIKINSLTHEQAEKAFPSSEYAIRYKAIADNIADADKKNNPTQVGTPYKASPDWKWFDTGARAAEKLTCFYGPHPIQHDKKVSMPYNFQNPSLRLWPTENLEKTVNKPLSKYYQYVNDDDHWVNPNAVNLDDDNTKGEK